MSTAGVSRRQIPSLPAGPELEQKIRERAYQLFLDRGAAHGRALEDWLQAEAECTQKLAPPASLVAQKARARRK